MKKLILLLLPLSLSTLGYTQAPTRRIDSIVKVIESEKTLKVKMVCDTSAVSNSDLNTIECLKFYYVRDRLLKAIYSFDSQRKDSARNNNSTRFDIFYYKDDLLIKVISKDFDQSPSKDLQFYLSDKDKKKFVSKETRNYSKYDGVNYFIESGYILLDEFKLLIQK